MNWSRRFSRLMPAVAGTLCVAVVAAGCGAPVSTSTALDSISAPNGQDWDPQSLPPLAVAGSGQGATPPIYGASVVTGQQELAVSLQPWLQVPSAPANVEYEFSVSTAGGAQSTMLWHKPITANKVQLPLGVVHQGGVYQWQAVAIVSGTVYGPYFMTVDQNRTGKQPSQTFGPLSVALASGAVTFGVGLRSVQGASGPLGINLTYQLGNPVDTGVPQGWLLQGKTQGWDHLQVQLDGSVSMVDSSGFVTAYVPNATGNAYTPISSVSRAQPTGSAPTLVKNPDNTWTSTMETGWSAIFGQQDSAGIAYLTQSYDGANASPSYLLDDGKITTIQDAIAPDLQVVLNYQGNPACPTPPDGFVQPPDGMLCSITYPQGGDSTDFFYLQTQAQQLLLARIVDYPNTHDSKASVTDLGYDQAGRIVSVREPIAADALASGVRTDEQQVLTTVTYDAQSRASVITRPAAQQGQPQPISTIHYPSDGVASITQNLPTQPPNTNCGLPPDTYCSLEYTYDPATLLPLTSTNAKGETTRRTWDTSQDLPLTDQDQDGRTTSYTYDQNNNLVSQLGPVPSKGSSGDAPKTTYTYDQDLSGNVATDLRGFNVTYWSNGQLVGGPAGRTFGPSLPGTGVPPNATWTWPQGPTGQANQWSARMLGTITLPSSLHAKRQDKPDAQNYGFSISSPNTGQSNASLWIDDISCPPPSCVLPLQPGPHSIRIDLPVLSPGTNGEAGIAVDWLLPGTSRPQPIPMAAISPNYGQPSITAVRDAYATDKPFTAQSFADYSNPGNSKPTSVWVPQGPQDSNGNPLIVGKSDYEQFAPDAGTYGRALNSTLPAGNQVTYEYYDPQDPNGPAVNPCTGEAVEQYGRLKSTSRTLMPQGDNTGAQIFTNYYNPMGNVVAGQISIVGDSNDGLTSCASYNDAGQLIETDTPARGDQPAATSTTTYVVNGNPFVTSTTVEDDGGRSYTSTAQSDLYGKTLSLTDAWGYTMTSAYDPYTGHQLSVVTAAPGGATVSNRSYSYYPNGSLYQVTLNGQVVATVGAANSHGNTVKYGNNVSESVTLGDIGTLSSQQWTASDGQTFSYSTTKAPSQRVLSEQLSFGSSASYADYTYTYDGIGRLQAGSLNTSADLQPSQTGWAYGFDKPTLGGNANAGLNSNRTAQTVTAADGSTSTINYAYNDQDQLTQTTDPRIGEIGYSTWGEINQLGTLTIDYTAASQVSKITDSKSGDSVIYRRAGSQLVAKTQTLDGVTTTSQYASDGLVLDGNNKPQWQAISLPGDVTLIRDLNSGNQQWQFQTARKQKMWVADQNGHDTGERHLYSPFGEELLTNPPGGVAANSSKPAPHQHPRPHPRPSRTSSPQSKPSTTSTPTPTPSASATASPSPSPSPTSTPDVPIPNLGWQAGNNLETQQVGSMTVIDMGSRLYVPALGRFTSADPTANGSVNAYDYANQDPINQSDPSGQMPHWLSVLIGIGISVFCLVVANFATMFIGSIFGITAEATTIAGRAAYIGTQMMISAATSMLATETNDLIFNTNGGFFSNEINNIEMAVSVMLAGVMARALIWYRSGGIGRAVENAGDVLQTAAERLPAIADQATGVLDQTNTAMQTVTRTVERVGQALDNGARLSQTRVWASALLTYLGLAGATGGTGIPLAAAALVGGFVFRYLTRATVPPPVADG